MVSQTKLVYSVFGPIGPIYRNFDLSGRTKNDFALVYFRFLNAPYDQSQIVTICLAPKEIWQVIFHNTQWYHYLEIILDNGLIVSLNRNRVSRYITILDLI